jgi:hypothetical protein
MASCVSLSVQLAQVTVIEMAKEQHPQLLFHHSIVVSNVAGTAAAALVPDMLFTCIHWMLA